MIIKYQKGTGEWRFRKTRAGQWLGRVYMRNWRYHFGERLPNGSLDGTDHPVESAENHRDIEHAANLYLNRKHGLSDQHLER